MFQEEQCKYSGFETCRFLWIVDGAGRVLPLVQVDGCRNGSVGLVWKADGESHICKDAQALHAFRRLQRGIPQAGYSKPQLCCLVCFGLPLGRLWSMT